MQPRVAISRCTHVKYQHKDTCTHVKYQHKDTCTHVKYQHKEKSRHSCTVRTMHCSLLSVHCSFLQEFSCKSNLSCSRHDRLYLDMHA